jgi:hypothetical protein
MAIQTDQLSVDARPLGYRFPYADNQEQAREQHQSDGHPAQPPECQSRPPRHFPSIGTIDFDVSLDRRIVEQAWGHKQTTRVVAHATARDGGPTLSFAAGKRAVRWRPEAIIRFSTHCGHSAPRSKWRGEEKLSRLVSKRTGMAIGVVILLASLVPLSQSYRHEGLGECCLNTRATLIEHLRVARLLSASLVRVIAASRDPAWSAVRVGPV